MNTEYAHWMGCSTHANALSTGQELAAMGIHGVVRGNQLWSNTPFPQMKKALGKWNEADELLS